MNEPTQTQEVLEVCHNGADVCQNGAPDDEVRQNGTPVERTGPRNKAPYSGDVVRPGVPPRPGSTRRSIPAELWVLARAVAEGRRLPMDQICQLTGLSKDALTMRSHRDGWDTPNKIARRNTAMITDAVSGILEDVAGFIETENNSDELPTKTHGTTAKLLAQEQEIGDYQVEEVELDSLINAKSCNPPSGDDDALRVYAETPAKFRPKDTDLLRPVMRTGAKLKQLQAMASGLEGHLKQMARTHQLAEAEITQAAFVYMHDAVERDPGLAVIFAPSLEKLSKMARRNFKLDQADPLDGAKKAIEMSDPEFVALPAPTIPEEAPEETASLEEL